MIRTSSALSGAFAVAVLSLSAVAQALTVPPFNGPGVSSPGYPDFWGGNADATLTRNSNGTFTLSLVGSAAGCGATLSNCGGAIFNFQGGSYLVGNESLNLTANFSSKGVFTSGSYTITGSLPASSNPTFGAAPSGFAWGAQATETLLTANLTADTIDSSAEALGFTEVITGGWADQSQFTGTSSATDTESLWLYSLLSGVDGDHGGDRQDSCGRDDSTCRHDSGWKHGHRGRGDSSWDKFLAELQDGRALKPNGFLAVGSVATVPLPDALWLFGSGLLGLVGLARRRALRVAS